MKNPFKRREPSATPQLEIVSCGCQGRALITVGAKIRYPPLVIPQGPQGYIGEPPEEAGKEFTVVAIRFHWADKPQEHDVIFEVEDADGRRHRDVYYRFERPIIDPSDTVLAFSM